jgi:hypothetical protein
MSSTRPSVRRTPAPDGAFKPYRNLAAAQGIGDGALAATWILAAGFIGLLGNVTSIGGAALVFGLGLVPPVLLIILRAVQRRGAPGR